jgi:hypothetical protein
MPTQLNRDRNYKRLFFNFFFFGLQDDGYPLAYNRVYFVYKSYTKMQTWMTVDGRHPEVYPFQIA